MCQNNRHFFNLTMRDYNSTREKKDSKYRFSLQRFHIGAVFKSENNLEIKS